MNRVMRINRNTPIPSVVGYARDVEEAKAVALTDARAHRRPHTRYYMERFSGDHAWVTVGRHRGVYRVLLVHDGRPSEEQVEAAMARFDTPEVWD